MIYEKEEREGGGSAVVADADGGFDADSRFDANGGFDADRVIHVIDADGGFDADGHGMDVHPIQNRSGGGQLAAP